MTELKLSSNAHYYATAIVPEEVLEDLMRRHSEPQRHYHTWRHVEEMFDRLEEVDEVVSCLPAVILATLFHDSVYVPRRNDNEPRSAVLLRRMGRGLDLYAVERADTLIMATQHHQLPRGEKRKGDCGYFLDMDLAILGASEARYDEYAAQIRAEYSHVDAEKFARGRCDALTSLLNRSHLFYTDWGREKWEAAARVNMRRERRALRKEIPK